MLFRSMGEKQRYVRSTFHAPTHMHRTRHDEESFYQYRKSRYGVKAIL